MTVKGTIERVFVTHDSVSVDSADSYITYDTIAETTTDSHVNANGHVIVDALLTRPGIFEYLASEIKPQWPDNAEVQKYQDSDIIRAYRSPESVTSDEYLESARYTPVTEDHPPMMLHPDTVRGYPVGTSTEHTSIDQGRPRVRLVLWDRAAIDARAAGKKEISVGAYNRFVWGPGTTDTGEPYDFEIRDSRVNHIAIVDRGRAGRGVKILDAEYAAPTIKEKTMKVSIGGVTFDLDDQAVILLNKERSETTATAERLNGQIEALKSSQGPTMDQAEFDAAVSAEIDRLARESEVSEARKTVMDAGFDVEGKSDEYIIGMCEALGRVSKRTSDAGVRFEMPTTTTDSRAKLAKLKNKQYRK